MKFADLHLHTVFSDSSYTPEELIKEAAKNNLTAISIVDHDTVDGIIPTFKFAAEKKIELIPGIELSAEYEKSEIHILGYFVDYQNHAFIEKLELLQKNRVERIYKIIDKLKTINIELDPQAVFHFAKDGTPSRLHIARAMAKNGLVSSVAEAFQKYIGDNGPAYVGGFKFNPKEAINFIVDFGGIPVLAHPYLLRNDELIKQFIQAGLMGLEVYYPEHTQSMINFYLNLAKEYNLLITGGSDCHGKAKPEVKIGQIKLPYEFVEKLKMAKEKLVKR